MKLFRHLRPSITAVQGQEVNFVFLTFKYTLKNLFLNTIKLSFKELLNKEQIGISEPSPVTNLPVYLINSEQIGISEQFCDDQKVS
jgi:hypothetical protein